MFGESSECVGVCVWMLSMWSHGSWGTLSVSPVCGMPVMLKCVCVCEGQYWGVWSLCVDFLEITAYFLVYLNRAHTRGGTPMLTGSVFGSETRGQIFRKLLTCQQPTDGGESQQMRLCVSTGKT